MGLGLAGSTKLHPLLKRRRVRSALYNCDMYALQDWEMVLSLGFKLNSEEQIAQG